MINRPALALFLLLPLQPVLARTLEVCVSDVDSPPFSYPDHEGQGLFLLRNAAVKYGDALRIVIEPRRRCLDNVEHGRYQVLLVAANTPSMLAHYAFPLRDGQPDPRRSIGAIDNYLIRVKGSAIAWDGRNLTGMTKPILHLSGRRSTADHLAELGIVTNDQASQPEQIAEMLLNGRGEAAVLTEREWRRLQSDPRVGQKLEAMSPTFQHLDIYCAFNRQFAEAHADYVEKIWNEFPPLRAGSQWDELVKSLDRGRE